MKPYDVLDVSRFVVNYSNKKEYGMTNLKLQKVLFYIQVGSIMSEDNPGKFFSDPIQAWDFGPVVPRAYFEFKLYGSSNIPTITKYLDLKRNEKGGLAVYFTDYDEEIILEEDRKDLEDIVDYFSQFTAYDLVLATHDKSPWTRVYKKGENVEITEEDIIKYYEK